MTIAKEAFKLKDLELTDYYEKRMSRNTDSKVKFFQQAISENLGLFKSRQIHVVDVGCGSGKLLKELQAEIPHIEYSGFDISEELIRKAKRQTVEIKFIVANALKELFKSETVSFFLLSSIFHELYSYNGDGFNINGIKIGLNLMKNALMKNGCILIKDPIGPENKNEYIKCILNSTKIKLNIQENYNMPNHQYNLVKGCLIHIDDSIIQYLRQDINSIKLNLDWINQLLLEKAQSLNIFLDGIGVPLEKLLNGDEKDIRYINLVFKKYIEEIDLANLRNFDIHMLELVSPPNALSRNARLVRFIYEFKPYRTISEDGILKINNNGEFTIPATFLSEAARHISPGIGRTNKGRYSELMEYYGPLNKTELEELGKQNGFKSKVDSLFIPTNHANRLEEEMKLFDLQGNTICQCDRLPTHQFSILKKI